MITFLFEPAEPTWFLEKTSAEQDSICKLIGSYNRDDEQLYIDLESYYGIKGQRAHDIIDWFHTKGVTYSQVFGNFRQTYLFLQRMLDS